MKRYLTIMLTVAGACALQAQTDPLSTEAKQAYNGIKNNLIKMAEKMPEENYSFKASPDIRTFGALVGHIADAQIGTCSAVNGQPKPGGASSKTAKADLVSALKASFEECDTAYGSLTDATATQMIKTRRGERSKLGALVGNTIHDNEEYGYMCVYLRIKGVVPPSSEGR
jgi:hypothetical protein